MRKILILSIISFTIIACAKWVNVDLSNSSIVLISPIDNHSDSLQSKTFSWEELEGSKEYRIQIATPSFDSIVTIVVDSTVDVPTLSISLTPGSYQWRVRGENEDFQSIWVVRNLEISSAASVNGQSIENLLPFNFTKSNELAHTFTWDPLISADQYIVKVKSKNGTEIFTTTQETNSYDYTFLNEGEFLFSVQAINDLSASFTTENMIHLDTTKPAIPTLVYPNLDTIKNFPQTFIWTVATNNGTTIFEHLTVASDSLMNSIILDTTFTENTSIALDTIPTSGKLFWKIERTDDAGNIGKSSNAKSFWIF